ncbi:MAG: GTPase ObgE [Bacteroidales bacterium]|jgi:GTP-binding protein|nr:GTPase ObgE [Bacteroidales bacterium]
MSEEGNFIDYIKIYCQSGKGGSGSVHFRREKYIPRGGPDGGDGGRGGHIIVKGNKNLWTLLHLKYTKIIKAENGQSGSGKLKTGADGKDAFIEVPIGTVIKEAESGQVITEINDDKQEFILLKGGKGGKGNSFFKSSTRQAPKFAQPGEDYKSGNFIFELKLLADVGLVGFPNAGKSTLLSVLSAAKPKIADYPFTTLLPQLGVVPYRDYQSFTIADIPGIIEGASEGKGLGLRFLRHIERNSILLFMIPITSKDHLSEYHILLNELEKYNPTLLSKKRVVAITKTDLADSSEINYLKEKLSKINPIFISSITGYGIKELKDHLWFVLNDEHPEENM